jgi:hypothetical protein
MAPGIFAIISAVKVVACSIYVQEVAFTFYGNFTRIYSFLLIRIIRTGPDDGISERSKECD